MRPFILLSLCWLSSLFLGSCNSPSSSTTYKIAIDPTWYPLDLMEKEINVYAFSNELLQEIAKVKQIQISKFNINWDNLFFGLEKKNYEGILSSMQPYLFNRQSYDFSELFLPLAPVLILPFSSTTNSFKLLKGKEIAVLEGSSTDLILEQYPDILIRTYDSIPKALNDIVYGVIDGAVIDNLIAQTYIQDLYHGILKIATPPLNNEGLRLITLKGSQAKLITLFNEGLDELKKNGTYSQLLQKWSLGLLVPTDFHSESPYAHSDVD